MGLFVQGMSALAYIVIAIFFLRFWHSTRDRLFLMLAIAFSLMWVTRIVSAALGSALVHSGYVFSFRFLAYLLIVLAIMDKNRPRRPANG